MFFEEKLKSIEEKDTVLEIGPGSSPHSRSNAFLELEQSESDRLKQRGHVVEDPEFGDRPVFFYDGKNFPFKDNEFDYVICSHVLEHVENPEQFLTEIFRVGGGKGYIEYPLVTYEFLYNFQVHLNFIKFIEGGNTLVYLPKDESNLKDFYPVNKLLYRTLEKGWNDLCACNKELFFEGFEFNSPFEVKRAESIEELVPPLSNVQTKTYARSLSDRMLIKLGL